jgi:UDP-2-acetamido-2,6-beta-L-arabino-hexul-4-ose reductase
LRLLVTGAQGFIGKNLLVRLRELGKYEVLEFVRGDSLESLNSLVSKVDAVVHLAGENRPHDVEDFTRVNVELTQALCAAIKKTGKKVKFILASSTQAENDSPYGISKRDAEKAVERFSEETGCPAIIYRFPGVFGKWCRPNYNSVVATFCHNIANDLPVEIHDAKAPLRLIYIDDVVSDIIEKINSNPQGFCRSKVEPEYATTVGALSQTIHSFRDGQKTLVAPSAGTGLVRALYATYMSYLPKEKFFYDLKGFSDPRGTFAEIIKTENAGQFSYFTAAVNATRGSHYHHTKTEKFLVIQGKARFRYRHLLTNEIVELHVSGEKLQIVETIPGWAHEITNTGDVELLVLLWANEMFDREHPDTIACKV